MFQFESGEGEIFIASKTQIRVPAQYSYQLRPRRPDFWPGNGERLADALPDEYRGLADGAFSLTERCF